jgi:hypothetical protein
MNKSGCAAGTPHTTREGTKTPEPAITAAAGHTPKATAPKLLQQKR